MNVYTENSKAIWFLLLITYAAFYIGGHIENGWIFAYSSVIVLFVVCLFMKRFKVCIKYAPFHIYLLLFCVFCYLSGFWAENPAFAHTKCVDMISVLIITTILAWCYQYTDSIEPLLKLIMWLGYVLTIYTFVFFGVGNVLVMVTTGLRISNDAINANTLGEMCAYAILINLYFIIKNKRIPIYSFLSIISLIMLAASSSRKAIIILVGGILGYLIIKNHADRDYLKKLVRIALLIILAVVMLYAISHMTIFSNVFTRFQTMISLFTGSGTVDYSTSARTRLIRIGMELFKSHPILGIGMDNAKIYGGIAFGIQDYYMHNNYVELLADGGIVGFALYYSMYLYFIIALIKYKDLEDVEYIFCFVLLIVNLVMDYGMVSYDSKIRFIFSIMTFIKISKLKQARYEVNV